MKKPDKAAEYFKTGCNCSQAVALAFTYDAGVDESTILKAMAGFGGGIGRTDQICGAVSGAVMIIGLKYATGPDKKELVYAKVKELTEKFKARNKTVSCTGLLGCNMSTPAGLEEAKKKEAHQKICPKVVRDAVEILEEIL